MFKLGQVCKIPSGLGGIFNVEIIEINTENIITVKILGWYAPHWRWTFTPEKLQEQINQAK